MDPVYMPEYTSASDLERSWTGTHLHTHQAGYWKLAQFSHSVY